MIGTRCAQCSMLSFAGPLASHAVALLIGAGLAAASVAQSLLEVYDAGDYCEHAEDRASRHA